MRSSNWPVAHSDALRVDVSSPEQRVEPQLRRPGPARAPAGARVDAAGEQNDRLRERFRARSARAMRMYDGTKNARRCSQLTLLANESNSCSTCAPDLLGQVLHGRALQYPQDSAGFRRLLHQKFPGGLFARSEVAESM